VRLTYGLFLIAQMEDPRKSGREYLNRDMIHSQRGRIEPLNLGKEKGLCHRSALVPAVGF
jgi:hypothetical protein